MLAVRAEAAAAAALRGARVARRRPVRAGGAGCTWLHCRPPRRASGPAVASAGPWVPGWWLTQRGTRCLAVLVHSARLRCRMRYCLDHLAAPAGRPTAHWSASAVACAATQTAASARRCLLPQAAREHACRSQRGRLRSHTDCCLRCRCCLLRHPASSLRRPLNSALVSQRITRPQMVAALVVLPAHIGTNYLLIHTLG